MKTPEEEQIEHQPIARSQNDFNPHEDDLIDSIWLGKKTRDSASQGVILFFSHLFFGFGMFYINPTNKRKWIYPIFAL